MSIWFSRTDTGFRGWFQAVRSTGELRTGATFNEFTFVVVSPDDSGSQEFFVSESQQKSGLYFADIQGSYLVTSGAGDYGVSVEINIGIPSSVTSAFSSILHVTQEDWDSLSGSLFNSSVGVSISSSSIENISNSVWESIANEHLTSGTMGWLQNQIVDTLLSGTGGNISSSSIDNIVNAVWNEILSGEHDTSGSAGKLLQTAGTGGVDTDLLAAAVWNRDPSLHLASGTMGWIQNKILINSASIDKVRAMTCGRWIISGSQMIFYDDDNVTEVTRFNLFDTEGDAFFSEANAPAERVVTGSV
jgi:hypothetical protein